MRALVNAASDPPPALRALDGVHAKVMRRRAVATIFFRFSVSEPVRLEARLTPLRSKKPLAFLPSTSLAGARMTTPGAVATAAIRRAGTYLLAARLPSRKIVRGHTYLLRLTATDAAGLRRGLTIHVTG